MIGAVMGMLLALSTGGVRACMEDPDFGTDGISGLPFSPSGSVRPAIQADGRIVVVGVSAGTFALARYLSNGALDVDFGSRGVSIPSSGPRVWESVAVATRADGRIVVVGSGVGEIVVARYLPSGSLDPSFGSAGSVLLDIDPRRDDVPLAAAIDGEGRILVGGESRTRPVNFTSPFWVVRFDANGKLDPSFDGDGKVTTVFDPSQGWGRVEALLVQPDGKIVAGGLADSFSDPYFGVVARYDPDGTLDLGFGEGGKISVHAFSEVTALGLQPDGALLVGGHVVQQGRLRRYSATGQQDKAFGTADLFFNGEYAGAPTEIFVRPDGRIVTGPGPTVSEVDGSEAREPWYFHRFRISEQQVHASMQADGKLVWAGSLAVARDLATRCGDGVVEGCEACEYPTTNPPWCASSCRVGYGWVCTFNPLSCARVTTTTTLPRPTTTTLRPSVTSTTTRRTPVTSTTLPCEHDPRCALDVLAGPACAGERPPAAIRSNLDAAASLITRASGASAKSARRMFTKAAKRLRAAVRIASKASRGAHPKLSPACATAISNAVARQRTGFSAP